jgi:acetolactate synthase-1/2/3 large subunit
MGNLLYPNARFVHFDSKPQVVMGGNRSADCYLQCDARRGIEALDSLLAKRSVKLTGFRTPEVKKKLIDHFADNTEFDVEPGTVDPREVCLLLDEMLPTDVALVSGTGMSAAFSVMNFNRPRRPILLARVFSCIGQGLPTTMGAMAATGNKPTLLMDGDAGFMMHFSDFDTVVRYNMPLLAVVLNDQALGSEYQKMRAHNMKAELSIIPTPDLGAVAKAYGGRGRLARSIDELRVAATEWLANLARW